MNRELTYSKWIKYIHDYQLNKNKKMKVKIMQRSVYHKYAEIEVEVPELIDGETEVHTWLMENEDKWNEKMDKEFSKAPFHFGNGMETYDWTDRNEESEWMYMADGIGGHL